MVHPEFTPFRPFVTLVLFRYSDLVQMTCMSSAMNWRLFLSSYFFPNRTSLQSTIAQTGTKEPLLGQPECNHPLWRYIGCIMMHHEMHQCITKWTPNLSCRTQELCVEGAMKIGVCVACRCAITSSKPWMSTSHDIFLHYLTTRHGECIMLYRLYHIIALQHQVLYV